MYFLDREGLGELPWTAPWRVREGLITKPQYLSFLSLDNFGIEKSVLTKEHDRMLDNLVRTVDESWTALPGIDLIRLVGHTDSTGEGEFNVGLGDRRARAVEQALLVKLKNFVSPLPRPPLITRVAVVVEPSPGKSKPKADNGTAEGRERNRRVDVFTTRGGLPPPPEPKPKIDVTPKQEPQGPIIMRKPDTIPDVPVLKPRPGQSLKQWFDERLSDHHVPKLIRNKIWDAIFDKNFGLVSSLLGAAGIDGPEKNALVETARVLAESKVR